ncbi:MAG: hypothetical protein LBL73_03740 [Synergistaceae bacterium]|jgi:hypothetical protein|nr:hypothetical protein [Synergistaceae bacterium]
MNEYAVSNVHIGRISVCFPGVSADDAEYGRKPYIGPYPRVGFVRKFRGNLNVSFLAMVHPSSRVATIVNIKNKGQ